MHRQRTDDVQEDDAGGKLDKDINAVVNDMSEEKLDWALQQLSNTLKKKSKTEQM